MKKFLLLLSVFLYIVPTVGFSVTAHYCGGKLASISLTASDEQACVCGSKKIKKNCCKNKIVSVKIKDGQQTPTQLNPDFKAFELQLLFLGAEQLNFQFKQEAINSFYYKHRPPDRPNQPLFLLNRVFRI
ncbi:MAG: hypothetical protein V4608_13495 [Bacteroidota bacterium]